LKRTTGLIAAGAAAFVITLVVCMPARVLGFWLPPDVAVGTLSGTVWNGSTDTVAIAGRPLGSIAWRIRPLHFLRGRLMFDGQLAAGGGSIGGRFALGIGPRVEAWNVELRWPLDALPLRAVPPGWSGVLQGTISEAAFSDGRIQKLQGILDARELRQPAPNAVAIGSYRLLFDERARQGEALVGQLQDLDGPMQVSGSLTLGAQRDYTLEGQVAPRPNAPQSITDTLRFLGTPDAQGRRPFSIAGTY
jgi:general secretion pathway protein N